MALSTRAVTGAVLVSDTTAVDLSVTTDYTKSLVVHNRSGVLFVKLGKEASAENFTYRLNKDAILELDGYMGPLTAVKQLGVTFVDVTEII